MKAYIHIALVVVVLVCAAVAQDNGAPPPTFQFKAAHQSLVDADKARDGGDLAKALESYQQAATTYKRLAKRYPAREAIVVEFRIAYCGDQIENLRKVLGVSAPVTTPLDSVERPDDSAQRTDESVPPVEITEDRVELVEEIVEVDEDKFEEVGPRPSGALISGLAAEGRDALAAGDLSKARGLLMHALDADPDDSTVRLLLGMVQCRAGRFEDATYILAELINEDKQNALAHVALGTAYFGMGRTGDAGTVMKRALDLNPDLHEAHYNMVQIVLATKPLDKDAARQHYDKVLKLGGAKDKKLEAMLE